MLGCKYCRLKYQFSPTVFDSTDFSSVRWLVTNNRRLDHFGGHCLPANSTNITVPVFGFPKIQISLATRAYTLALSLRVEVFCSYTSILSSSAHEYISYAHRPGSALDDTHILLEPEPRFGNTRGLYRL